MKKILQIIFVMQLGLAFSQSPTRLYLKVTDSENNTLNNIAVNINEEKYLCNQDGSLDLELPISFYQITINQMGYEAYSLNINLQSDTSIHIYLIPSFNMIEDVVITAKATSPFEKLYDKQTFTTTFLERNLSNNIFQSIQSINGLRAQTTCGVCNTGVIQLNGMEGGNTLILIDGMPIMGGLSSVYGLYGIPNSMIEKIEISKESLSTLYGSDAVAGTINVITKNPIEAKKFFADVSINTYGEINAIISSKFKLKDNVHLLSSIDYYNLPFKADKNNDNFTDIALQNRVSIFNKLAIEKNKFTKNIVLRYIYENRWGGELQWKKQNRGGTDVYAESIINNRFELLGDWNKKNISIKYAYIYHKQDAAYADLIFLANQQIGFVQTQWMKNIKKTQLMIGGALRYNFYKDNILTISKSEQHTFIPGIFAQASTTIGKRHTLTYGLRYDFHSRHKSIFSPRINYAVKLTKNQKLTFNIASGYRVANVLIEDHAALSGARSTEFKSQINPESSWNFNINYTKKMLLKNSFIDIDIAGFYNHFTNKIIADYLTDANKIIFDNLSGHATNYGFSFAIETNTNFGLNVYFGTTLLNSYIVEKTDNTRQKLPIIFVPNSSTNWSISYDIKKIKLTVSYTGNLFSPMHLPTQPNDFRPNKSPIYSIQNIQLSKYFKNNIEIYLTIKNILNFKPKNPIMRPEDPFDKNADDPTTNPNGYTFDPSYAFESLQGVRCLFGFRYSF